MISYFVSNRLFSHFSIALTFMMNQHLSNTNKTIKMAAFHSFILNSRSSISSCHAMGHWTQNVCAHFIQFIDTMSSRMIYCLWLAQMSWWVCVCVCVHHHADASHSNPSSSLTFYLMFYLYFFRSQSRGLWCLVLCCCLVFIVYALCVMRIVCTNFAITWNLIYFVDICFVLFHILFDLSVGGVC